MYSCQCYQIGGPFIAEDPDCPYHQQGGARDQIDALESRIALLEQEIVRLTDLLTPLIAAIAKVPDFSGLIFTLNGSKFMYGHLINTIISFCLVAAAIFFFVIKPMNFLISKSHKESPADPTTKKCPECLSEIPLEAKRCSHCTQIIS